MLPLTIYPPSRGNFSGNEREIRQLCIDLGLTADKSRAYSDVNRRIEFRLSKAFEEDRKEYQNLAKSGYALRGRKSIPCGVGSSSFDYQLELPFVDF